MLSEAFKKRETVSKNSNLSNINYYKTVLIYIETYLFLCHNVK